ncbi:MULTISPECIES: hypothetical protein [unclassified Chryseobacterium]|uniref:hypothetical protein n=1 Tax=unclassified Chryseobacterium TaxID=2593645 RepID=UPI000F44FCD0|nr:hypothetical protein [Chryseobacterium sp. G0240]ROI05868.1 hypothetical protein EGI16_05670 [Chryseobacterium sp. G0240]
MKPKPIKGVPRQKFGGFHDTESEKQFDPALIPLKFEILKRRFFMINHWKSYCGSAFADFKLYDSNAEPVERDPQKGDFIRIDIPGPGEPEAKGYDWVEVSDICYYQDSVSESIMMTCRPCKNPKNKKNDHIAHFYSSKATSTFMISKGHAYLKTAVYGRNESPNFKAGFIDVVRNIFVAAGGMMGIAKIQWKVLTDGFLDFE